MDYILADARFTFEVTPVHRNLLVSSYGAENPRFFTDALGNIGKFGLERAMGALNYQEVPKKIQL